MFYIQKSYGGPVINEKTRETKLFKTRAEAQTYIDLSHMRGATVQSTEPPCDSGRMGI